MYCSGFFVLLNLTKHLPNKDENVKKGTFSIIFGLQISKTIENRSTIITLFNILLLFSYFL
jgi:hypothetical protein